MQNRKVTICACVSRSFIDKDKVAGIAARMKREGYDVRLEADLCRKAMTAPAEMEEIAGGSIMACSPRAVRSHLDWLGLGCKEATDIREYDYKEETDNRAETVAFKEQIEAFPPEHGVDAWYPVIDKARCTECGKCHDFCLFGVYTIENKKVRVTRPQNCKNNCPACARMCPGKAIIFPKYGKSPINGGTAIEETFNPEDMDKMYRERLRMRLQQRRAGVSLLKQDNK